MCDFNETALKPIDKVPKKWENVTCEEHKDSGIILNHNREFKEVINNEQS